jgi:hypothetical protein
MAVASLTGFTFSYPQLLGFSAPNGIPDGQQIQGITIQTQPPFGFGDTSQELLDIINDNDPTFDLDATLVAEFTDPNPAFEDALAQFNDEQ